MCRPKTENIFLYKTDNGFLSHTEIIVPKIYIKSGLRELLKEYIMRFDASYLGFSFGDEAFMKDRGGFEDINYTLALKGLFLPTSALMKVGFYDDIKVDNLIKINLSYECLNLLEEELYKSFEIKNSKAVEIDNPNSKYYYRYFRAKKSYNLFNTCNSWSGMVLRSAGVKTGLWTPFGDQVVYHLKKGYDE
jgi:hypothetical protein